MAQARKKLDTKVAAENRKARHQYSIEDTLETGVVEPAHAKRQAVSSAAEAANLVLKIDDIIAAGDLSTSGDGDEGGPGGPGGAPGGMGGMGGMGGAM